MMDFDVVSVRTLEEALDQLEKYEDEAKVIAGGQSMLNILKQGLMAPELLVDVKGLGGLDSIQISGGLRIGALTLHRTIELDERLDDKYPILREMERHLASVQIRNWGTLGGNLCIADPTGDPAPCLIVLDAEAVLARKGGERKVPMSDFFVDYYETVLEPIELMTWVEVPEQPPFTGTAYEKYRNVEGDAPIVVAAARVTLDEKRAKVADVRIALGGASPTPHRALEAEKILRGADPTDEAVEEASRKAPEETSPIPDITASVEFKRKLVRVLVGRTVRRARDRALEA